MRMATVGLAGLVIFAGWAGLTLLVLDSGSLGLTLLTLVGGPFLMAVVLGFAAGLSSPGAGARAGAAAALAVAVLTNAWGIWLRSTEAFSAWSQSLTGAASDPAGGDGQLVVSISTSLNFGELVLSAIMIVAVGYISGWIAGKVRGQVLNVV